MIDMTVVDVWRFDRLVNTDALSLPGLSSPKGVECVKWQYIPVQTEKGASC